MKFNLNIKQTNHIEVAENNPLPLDCEYMVSTKETPYVQIEVEDAFMTKKKQHYINCTTSCGKEVKFTFPNMIMIQCIKDGKEKLYYAISESIISKSKMKRIGNKSLTYEIMMKPNQSFVDLPNLRLIIDEEEFQKQLRTYLN